MLTGWEPDVPADDTLVRRFVLANLARLEALTQRVGGRWESSDAAVLCDAGSPVVLDNVVLLRRPVAPHELARVLADAERFFPARRPWLLMSVWPLPDLSTAGLRLMGHPPIMLRPAGPSSRVRPAPGELEIRRVDAGSAATFGATLERAYPLAGAGTSPWGHPQVLTHDVVAYLGFVEDEPVATSAAFVGHGSVDVEMVSCDERFRGRGIGEAMAWAATLTDPDSPAVLLSSDDGRPVYERMGYLPLIRMALWYRSEVEL